MAFKMAGWSPYTKKTDAEKADKLIKKREKLRKKKETKEAKGKKTKLIDKRLGKVQEKINENPEVKRWNAPQTATPNRDIKADIKAKEEEERQKRIQKGNPKPVPYEY